MVEDFVPNVYKRNLTPQWSRFQNVLTRGELAASLLLHEK
jgi:hypothetical protein